MRVLTNKEWDRLRKVVDNDDQRMHWHDIFSWVNDTDDTYGLTYAYCALRGFYTADFDSYSTVYTRSASYGFRPVIEAADSSTLWDGRCFAIGTLYMNGQPIQVPQNPTCDGDIQDYIPGATLELREALDDPAYQVLGIKVGSIIVADRNLLKRISYNDIMAVTGQPSMQKGCE